MLRVPVVLSSSEVMSHSLFQQASSQLGAQVIDYYGKGERVCFASTDINGRYRFNPAYGTVELANVAASQEIEGAMTADIIGTGHWNSAFPLVRYRTGDIAVLPSGVSADDVNAIARGAKSFLGILGRPP